MPRRRARAPLALLVATTVALFCSSGAGSQTRRPTEREPVGLDSLRPIAGIYPDVMTIFEAPDATVWVASKYDVNRFPDGDVDRREVVLDQKIYENRFGGKMSALSTATGAPDGTLWAGSWYGELLRYEGGAWSRVLPEPERGKSKIESVIADRPGTVWMAASSGVWRMSEDDDDPGPQPVRSLPPGAANTLIRADAESLLVGHRQGAWRSGPEGWGPVWRGRTGLLGVTALLPTATGGLLLGTEDGFVELDAAGEEIGRSLPGRWVTGFQRTADGRRLVATWKEGLFLESARGWLRLGHSEGLQDDSLISLLLDSRDRLWLGLYGHGVWVGELDAVYRAAVPVDTMPAAEDTVFTDACEAAAELLAGATVSGQIAVESDDETTYVFLDRELACPEGVGFRRRAGEWVAAVGDRLTHGLGFRPRRLDLPRGVPSHEPRALYIDADGDLWLGTLSQGLFRHTAGGWVSAGAEEELVGNAIGAIVEGANGSLWVGASPSFDRTAGLRLQAGLHRLTGGAWEHFSARDFRLEPLRPEEYPEPGEKLPDDLASNQIQDLAMLADGTLAIGSNGGLTFRRGGAWETFGRSETGLPHNFFFSITEAGDRLWFTHLFWGAGVSWKKGAQFDHRDSRDGLFADGLRKAAIDGDGRVWLLDDKHRVGVYPASFFEPPEGE